jgi:phage gp36-like protein
MFCKDIAIYNLIELDQSGVDVSARTKRYERAVAWLKQANESVLSSLPMATNKTAANIISYTSKEKNNNYFD